MKYSPIDAIAIILEAFKSERNRTILERFLTRRELQAYFSTLQQSHMLAYQQENETYKTTDIGISFLRVYKEVEELVTPAGV